MQQLNLKKGGRLKIIKRRLKNLMKYFSEVENLFDKKIKEQLKDASNDVIGLMVNIIWPLSLPSIKAYRRSCVEIF